MIIIIHNAHAHEVAIHEFDERCLRTKHDTNKKSTKQKKV